MQFKLKKRIFKVIDATNLYFKTFSLKFTTRIDIFTMHHIPLVSMWNIDILLIYCHT